MHVRHIMRPQDNRLFVGRATGRWRLSVAVMLLCLYCPTVCSAYGAADVFRPTFSLRASNGQKVDNRTFSGKVQIILFGYLDCPDVCPMTLSAVSQAVKGLGARERDVRILFISVNPDRDRPEQLAQYARAFGPRVIGMTGTRAQIDAAVKALGARYRIFANDADRSAVSHTGNVYILGRSGRLLATLPPNTTTQKYRALLGKILSDRNSGS